MALAPSNNPLATEECRCTKRKRSASHNEQDSSIRASARTTADSTALVLANDEDIEPAKKRARGRPGPNSDIVLERLALENILSLVGLQGVAIPQADHLENKSRRLRELEGIAARVGALIVEHGEHWQAAVDFEKEVDDAKEYIEELELSVAVRDDFEDLLEAEYEKVEELEKEKKALEEELAKLKEAVKAAFSP